MQTTRLSLRNGLIALMVAYPVLTGLAIFYGDHYGRATIPLYQATISVIAPEYKLASFEIRQPRSEKVLFAEFVAEESRVVGGGVLPAGTSIQASTLLSHALQHAIVMYTLIAVCLVSSNASLARWLTAAALSLPGLALVEVLDVPFVLAGSVEDLVVNGMSAGEPIVPPVTYWMNFLNGGGRLALAAAGGVLTVSLAVLTTPYGPRRRHT